MKYLTASDLVSYERSQHDGADVQAGLAIGSHTVQKPIAGSGLDFGDSSSGATTGENGNSQNEIFQHFSKCFFRFLLLRFKI